jgi:membrane protease YdiL (CAAX protease family)
VVRQFLKSNVSSKYFQIILFLVTTLAVFNITFVNSAGWAKVLWDMAGWLVLFLIYKWAGLSLNDVGLSSKNFRLGLKYAGAAILVVLLVLGAVFLVHKTVFNDPRYHQGHGQALYAALILVPLKTVLFEELAFRGLLPALILKIKNSRRAATIISSVLFGLWHVSTAGGVDPGSSFLTILGVVIITSLAGAVFCELRWRSGSLVAPIAAHWAINGLAIMFASLSWS